ncbi:hypothetical protein XM38_004850 [Halomicronema hongdechloris C2206]|uniref:DUF4230 domain-containing protein n=1 Tax=Halomicronema hongdechloris C2206 TaxID=1641165 RepID=A0A1Z3HH32_9CYAN|nr:DUF4230 domain-containing protein [Halomicronema hongdechloris]ASC69558.1 hypothetical protein XM38_004850 [Halomicronema hongdechloris C2206]
MRSAPPKPPDSSDQSEQTSAKKPSSRAQKKSRGFTPLAPVRFVQGVGTSLVGIAVVMALLAGVGVWRSGDRFLEGLRLMLTAPQPEPEVDVRSVIIHKLQGASELTTAIFAMEAVVPTTSDRTLAGYVIGKTNLLYIAYGEVRAGVDLSRLDPSQITTGPESVRIQLPPAQILDSKLDVERSEVYDYDRGFLGLGPDNAPELQEMAQRQALQKITRAACSEGILTAANERAQLVVSQLLSPLAFESVQVDTQTPDELTCAGLANSDTVN